jgi:hypothetical protein
VEKSLAISNVVTKSVSFAKKTMKERISKTYTERCTMHQQRGVITAKPRILFSLSHARTAISSTLVAQHNHFINTYLPL